jgi:hypothetical protein
MGKPHGGAERETGGGIGGAGLNRRDDRDGAFLWFAGIIVGTVTGAIAAEEKEPPGKNGSRNRRSSACNRHGWRDPAPANGARRGWRGAAGA